MIISGHGNNHSPDDEGAEAGRSYSEGLQKRNLHANAQMGTRDIKRYCAVKPEAEKLLEVAINKLGLSACAYGRVLKVSRTIADLEGS